MSALSTISTFVPQIGAAASTINTAAKAVAASASELHKRAKIKDASQNFESTFLSTAMQSMFEGVKTEEPFGGGNGEEMFKSVMTDAMAKQMTKAGGIGLAATVQREMLKMQGLKEQ